MKLKILISALLALASIPVLAQTGGTIQFTAGTTSGSGSVTPVLTWSTTPAATSCTASGDWTGTKAAAGTETLAKITKSATYNIVCNWAGSTTKVKVTWVPTNQNTDGSPYTDAKGYVITYGTDPLLGVGPPAPTTVSVLVPNLTYTTPNLSSGTWYFVMRSVNALDVNSERSSIASTVIASATSGNSSIGITVNPMPKAPTLTLEQVP